MGRLARVIAASAEDMDAELSGQRRQASLQRADDARGDAGRMPVHTHHRAERLEPEGMRQPAQELVTAVLEDDRLGDHRAEPRHAVAQPFGHVPAVERQVGAARAPSHQRAPVAATRGAVSRSSMVVPPAPNSGSPSLSSAGVGSKFDTVTPSNRTPLAVGRTVRTSSTLARRRRSWRAITVGKLRLRVTCRKSANFTFTVTVRPKA